MTAPHPAPEIPPHLLNGMNPQQAEAVSTLTVPLLVVAGPGSGKTRVLTHRIAALLATGTRPGQILAVTFTNKAAAEMRDRVATLVGPELVRHMWIATFHSACVRILRAHHDLVGLPRAFSIVDAKDAAKIVADILKAGGHLDELSDRERKDLLKGTYRKISHAKNNDMSPGYVAESGRAEDVLVADTMREYNRVLRARGSVDFDDLLLEVLHLLRRYPHIEEHYQTRFSHVLVDEFQDTNTVQWEITRRLGGSGNVCVVGDADQSIYAFRGANPKVLDLFTRTYKNARVVQLGQNYRSTGAIVDVAQAVIDANPSQHRARLHTSNPTGEAVRLAALQSDWEEARWVVDQIQSRDGALSDHAILVRTNAQTRVLENVLRERALPHDVVGTVRFFDRAEVKDALSYLRLVVNPADVGALERAVGVPRRGIGPATLEQVTGAVMAGQGTIRSQIDQVIEQKGRVGTAWRRFADAWDSVTAAVSVGGPAAGLNAVLKKVGLVEYYTSSKSGDGPDRVDNLKELTAAAVDFIAGKSGSDPQGRVLADLDPWEQTEAFLEYAALMSSSEKPDSTRDIHTAAVQVATIHAAKGKEWPHVYVVGLEEGILPHALSTTEDEIGEERRLFFVAVSRAQQTLTISRAATRTKYGLAEHAQESSFLEDLPDTVERIEPFTDAVPPTRTPWGSPAPATRPRAGRAGGGAWQAPRAARLGVPSAPSRTPRPTHPLRTPVQPIDPGVLVPGAQVTHPIFGAGEVLELSGDVVKVRFPGGAKMLAVTMAPLTLV